MVMSLWPCFWPTLYTVSVPCLYNLTSLLTEEELLTSRWCETLTPNDTNTNENHKNIHLKTSKSQNCKMKFMTL